MRKKKRLPKRISSLIKRHRMYRCIKRIKKNHHNPQRTIKYIPDMPESEIYERVFNLEYSQN